LSWLHRVYLHWKSRRHERRLGPIISQSGLFDPAYYLKHNPDVASSGIDPLHHYFSRGCYEGRVPSEYFDPRTYIEQNPDVNPEGLNPLLHYIQHGRAEARVAQSPSQIIATSGLFDPAYYIATYPDATLFGQDPLQHYLRVKSRELRRPSLDFDPVVYRAHSPDVRQAQTDLLIHYIQYGRAEGRPCRHPGVGTEEFNSILPQIRAAGLFDDNFYIQQCPFLRTTGIDPLRHYLLAGFSHFLDPSPNFSTRRYKLVNPDICLSGMNPLLHSLGYSPDLNLSPPPGNPSGPAQQIVLETRAAGLYALRYGFSFDTIESPPNSTARAIADLVALSPTLQVERIHPAVTVIIPVFGQLHFVLGCLDSLSRHISQLTVEIIVADDASPEVTQTWRLSAIPWIRYHRSESNLGFVANCNRAACSARASYLVFLNSDTRVVEGWLDDLIASFTLFPQAGLIGSVLFNPDGSLQDAGGIFWRDGSAWNYGRDQDAFHPKFCFARQADYVSGASIAVPVDVWRKAGGFDTDYQPAYCEDADLAFRLREMGYQVWIQPLSRVLHYEGKTHGRDLSKGVKNYQQINMRKLLERWKDKLASHHPNGHDPDNEANRTVTKRMLVLDAITPMPDKDSGSFITIRMLRALQSLGYHITFVPQHNYSFDDTYTPALQRQGIECLYHPYFSNIGDVLDFRENFDVVLAYRYNVLEQVYDELRRRIPAARIVFHNVDLHFLRQEREAELFADSNKKIAAAIAKASELELIAKVDCTIVHTPIEKQVIQANLPVDNIVVFPYIAELHQTQVGFEDRRDIVFLGGLNHGPNADAVIHFAHSIWPELERQLPADARFFIVGAYPTSAVKALAGPRIVVTGYVKDLTPYFERARVFVAPIRYGAGIKGKVIQSLCYGTPSVISSIAAEGIGLVSGAETVIADDQATFAKDVRTVYYNRKVWYALQSAGYQFVDSQFSWNRCLELTGQVLATADTCWLRRHEQTLQSRLRFALRNSPPAPANGLAGGASAPATWVEPGHFYSPLVNPEDPHVDSILRSFDQLELPTQSAISLNSEKMIRLFTHLATRYSELPFVATKTPSLNFYYENDYFSYGDAIMLGLITLEFRPRRILEIGSGFSSAAMIDLNEQSFGGSIELNFVDPFPGRLLDLLSKDSPYRSRICSCPVQSVPDEVFKRLQRNDILFIDSTHVSKMGSDVNRLVLEVLPLIEPGVLIHLHDVFYPFEYPPSWITDENRSWNEAYLLRAFLEFNEHFEILFFNHFAVRSFRPIIQEQIPLFLKNGGGSIWLRRIK
jgi:GT2 family glycosyltransferase